MFIPDRPHRAGPFRGLDLFFALKGSILPRIARGIAACTLIALAATVSHGHLMSWKVTLTPVPFTLIGLALAICLGFRNSAAYERFWEARKLWGDLISRARTFARQQAWITEGEAHDAERDAAMLRRTIAFAHALRCELRGLDAHAAVVPWLSPDEAAQLSPARPLCEALLRANAQELGRAVREGRLPPPLAAQIDVTLAALSAAQAGCERIASTPIPFAYTLLLHRTAWLYCLLLPFGLVDLIGLMTPMVVAIVSYTFFGLDALGDEIEQPFGLRTHHLPLDALCRTIEIDLLEALGVRDLPAPIEATGSVLT